MTKRIFSVILAMAIMFTVMSVPAMSVTADGEITPMQGFTAKAKPSKVGMDWDNCGYVFNGQVGEGPGKAWLGRTPSVNGGQKAGDWFAIDMGCVYNIDQFIIQASYESGKPIRSAQSFSLYATTDASLYDALTGGVDEDGSDFDPTGWTLLTADGADTPSGSVTEFDPIKARYVIMVLNTTVPELEWEIQEVKVNFVPPEEISDNIVPVDTFTAKAKPSKVGMNWDNCGYVFNEQVGEGPGKAWLGRTPSVNGGQNAGDWFAIDMGCVYNIDQFIIQASYESGKPIRSAQSFSLYATTDASLYSALTGGVDEDGSDFDPNGWTLLTDKGADTPYGSVTEFDPINARYVIMVLNTTVPNIEWEIQEVKVSFVPPEEISDNIVPVDTFTAKAKHGVNQGMDWHHCERVFDGQVGEGPGKAWLGRTPGQNAGDWFAIDMGYVYNIDKFIIQASSGKPRSAQSFSLYATTDASLYSALTGGVDEVEGSSFNPTGWTLLTADGADTPYGSVTEFDPINARYVIMVLNTTVPDIEWEIQELRIHSAIPIADIDFSEGAFDGSTWDAWSDLGTYTEMPGFTFANAFDRDAASEWLSGTTITAGSSLMIDMKASKAVDRVLITNNEVHLNDIPSNMELFGSNDAAAWKDPKHNSWTSLGSRNSSDAPWSMRAPWSIEFTRASYRYLMLRSATSGSNWVISELYVYGSEVEEKDYTIPNLSFLVSGFSTYEGYMPTNVLLNNNNVWYSKTEKAAGDWFMVDMDNEYLVSQVIMDVGSEAHSAPNNYNIYTSSDPSVWENPDSAAWKPSATITGAADNEPAVLDKAENCRFIMIRLTDGNNNNLWGIRYLTIKSAEPISVPDFNSGAFNRSGWEVKTSIQDVEGHGPANAIDGSMDTSYSSGIPVVGSNYFMIDVQEELTVDKLLMINDVVHNRSYPYGLGLYGATSAEAWDNYLYMEDEGNEGGWKLLTENSRIQNPYTFEFNETRVRYLMLVATSCKTHSTPDSGCNECIGNPWWINELYVYGPFSVLPDNEGQLDRTGWTASATNSDSTHPLNLMLDGDSFTYWLSDTDITVGDEVMVDMKSIKLINKVKINVSKEITTAYPDSFAVYASRDGVNWGTPIGSGTGKSDEYTVVFDSAEEARYIKVVALASKGVKWSVAEFNVYSPFTVQDFAFYKGTDEIKTLAEASNSAIEARLTANCVNESGLGNYILFVGIYDGDELLNLKTDTPFRFSAGLNEIKQSVSTTDYAGATAIRAFVWNSLEGLRPLTNRIELK